MVVVGGVLGDGVEIVVGKERVDFVIVVLGVYNYCGLALISFIIYCISAELLGESYSWRTKWHCSSYFSKFLQFSLPIAIQPLSHTHIRSGGEAKCAV